MKNIILSIGLLAMGIVSAQFKVNIEAPDTFTKQKVVVYALNGSKDYIVAQADKKNGKWTLSISQYYKGMMRAYFPENGRSVHFIAENKEVNMTLNTEGDRVSSISYQDEANKNWERTTQYLERKQILPVLHQISHLYHNETPFSIALKNEIRYLENQSEQGEEGSFVRYFVETQKYTTEKGISVEEYKNFLVNSGDMLEASSLMRPILVNFLRSLSRENFHKEVDSLLETANLETHRGQTLLSELLSIFEAYGFEAEKEKYYQRAMALTCSINDNLKSSISAIKNTAIGATFQDYTFSKNVSNTKLKKLSDIKADKKVILFWSSTCPHCVSELPIILENYQKLKQKNIEVIALSVDSDAKSYENQVGALPWINDAELKGWNSSYAETYNVRATPTYYVLDSKQKIIAKPANFSAFLSSLNEK